MQNETLKRDAAQEAELLNQYTRKIHVPSFRQGLLKRKWKELITPLTVNMKLAVKYNVAKGSVQVLPGWVLRRELDLEESEKAQFETRLTKSVEYFKAFLCGFEPKDCLAILRLDNVFHQSFKITDVKRLEHDNLSRAIGRITGRKGRTREALQNSTRTRIIVMGKDIHIMGAYENIALARDAICSLILGSPPNKVHNHLSIVNRKMKERM